MELQNGVKIAANAEAPSMNILYTSSKELRFCWWEKWHIPFLASCLNFGSKVVIASWQ